jgi:glucokinase
VADIGGTHVRFRLLKMSKNIEDEAETLDTTKLRTSDYESLELLLKEYLSTVKDNYPEIAVIGIPGPVQDNTIMKLPNIPHWKSENGDNLGKKLNIKRFLFLNDFACNSYGIQTKLKLNEDYIILNEGEPKENGAKAIIGPGTGLGMGFLIKNKNDKYYTIGNSEGGHQGFSRKNQKFYELAEFVKKEYDLKYVTIENICSGQGMVPLYKFLLQKEKEDNNLKDINDVNREQTLAQKVDDFNDYSNKKLRDELSNEITQKGVKGECKLSRKVIELFIEILADAASDLSLLTMPSNGLYLLGGISVAIEPFIKSNNIFINNFIDKDHSFLLKSFPVYLIKNPNIGMIGASEAARRILEEQESAK